MFAFNKLIFSTLSCFSLGLGGLASFTANAATVYPSTATAWILPGFHADSFDGLDSGVVGKEALIEWELNHADSAFGATYGQAAASQINALGYMYTQKIEFSPADTEFGLRAHAKSVGDTFEDYFLHFSSDTIINNTSPNHSANTPLNRRPWVAGWTQDDNHLGFRVWQTPPYALSLWEHGANGGCAFVYMPEKFDQIQLSLRQAGRTGRLELSYPSAINRLTGVVSEWQTMTKRVIDGTHGLKNSGVIRWTPPSNWVEAATYDVVNKKGHHFGNDYLQQGAQAWVMKLCRHDAFAFDQPVVLNVQVKDWMPTIKAAKGDASPQRLIPGWDSRNDVNNDGYVSDFEFKKRVNPAASARFRYESRVTPLGQMWSENSSFQRPDFLNPAYRTAITAVTAKQWQNLGQVGAYNDSSFKLDNIDIAQGGILDLYDVAADSAEFKQRYQAGFVQTIGQLKQLTQSDWIAANISAENLFLQSTEKLDYINAFSTFLREDYLRPGVGLSGFFGLAKTWDTFALAALKKKVIMLAHANWRGDIHFENTKASWQQNVGTGLALYYLLNQTDSTLYHSWNSSFNYGSNNTSENNFYRAGVPKNIAYQPSAMLGVDIGSPSQSIQPWSGSTPTPMPYLTRSDTSGHSYMGDSTDTVLNHSTVASPTSTGSVTVQPSHIYYAWQSTETKEAEGRTYPLEMVLARDYSNALVLYHSDFLGGSPEFNQVSRRIKLPGLYQKLNYDGSLEPASDRVSVTGYEGVILLKGQ